MGSNGVLPWHHFEEKPVSTPSPERRAKNLEEML